MSKNVKILLIVAGILGFVSVACVGGFFLVTYLYMDKEGMDRAVKEGTEFGQTTDNLGCQTKIVPMIKSTPDTDINGVFIVQTYFRVCLDASRPTPNFCDGVANPFTDIYNEHKAKDAECKKLGLEGSITCRQVIDKKLDFCLLKK